MSTQANLTDTPAGSLGALLRRRRQTTGASLEEVAQRLNLAFTPIVLQMIESARYPLEEPQVLRVLWGYGLESNRLDQHLRGAANQPGRTLREIKRTCNARGLLREYLLFVYEKRGIAPGSPMPLSDSDLAVLSNTIDWPVDDIRQHLTAVTHQWRDGEDFGPASHPKPSNARAAIRRTCGAGVG
jgi:hypothetical protein